MREFNDEVTGLKERREKFKNPTPVDDGGKKGGKKGKK